MNGIWIETSLEKKYYPHLNFDKIRKIDKIIEDKKEYICYLEKELLILIYTKNNKEEFLVDFLEILKEIKEESILLEKYKLIKNDLEYEDYVKIYDEESGKYYLKKDNFFKEINKKEFENL